MASSQTKEKKGDWVWQRLSFWNKVWAYLNPVEYERYHENCELIRENYYLKKEVAELKKQLAEK